MDASDMWGQVNHWVWEFSKSFRSCPVLRLVHSRLVSPDVCCTIKNVGLQAYPPRLVSGMEREHICNVGGFDSNTAQCTAIRSLNPNHQEISGKMCLAKTPHIASHAQVLGPFTHACSSSFSSSSRQSPHHRRAFSSSPSSFRQPLLRRAFSSFPSSSLS